MQQENKLGTWTDHGLFFNYTWQQKIKGHTRVQRISVDESATNVDRGTYRAAYDVVTKISDNILFNYYFVPEIALREVESWAAIIDKTSDYVLGNIVSHPNHLEFTRKDNFNFSTSIEPVSLYFTKEYDKDDYLNIDVFRFDAVLNNDSFDLEPEDAFPRYYTEKAFALVEENNWIDVWTKQYQELNRK